MSLLSRALKGLGILSTVPLVPPPSPLMPAGMGGGASSRNFHQLLSGNSNIYSDVAGASLENNSNAQLSGGLDSMLIGDGSARCTIETFLTFQETN